MKKYEDIEPLGERIVVKRREVATQTQGGILLPEASKEKPKEGDVVCVGSEQDKLNVGDFVLFNNYAGTEISYKGEELIVMSIDDILIRVKE